MPLIPLTDFLMHGVVLQTRVSGRRRPAGADVSRETFLRKSRARIFRAPPNHRVLPPMFHVKHRCADRPAIAPARPHPYLPGALARADVRCQGSGIGSGCASSDP
jgi:hypothetical protein